MSPLYLNLDISNLRAQSYDGAASMRETYRGVAARILGENPLAMYVICHLHILNLCIVYVCLTTTAVRHMLANVQSLYNLIEGSAKWHAVFESLQEWNSDFSGKSTSLKPLRVVAQRLSRPYLITLRLSLTFKVKFQKMMCESGDRQVVCWRQSPTFPFCSLAF